MQQQQQLWHGAGGAEGPLRRAPRQVRGHQRVRLRVYPERPLVAAGPAARGPRERGERPTEAQPPELEEEGWYGELVTSLKNYGERVLQVLICSPYPDCCSCFL